MGHGRFGGRHRARANSVRRSRPASNSVFAALRTSPDRALLVAAFFHSRRLSQVRRGPNEAGKLLGPRVATQLDVGGEAFLAWPETGARQGCDDVEQVLSTLTW